ncbi:MAG TPA: hypothetical protein VIK78_19175 [Ruminiclostridium sp.]
MSVGFNRLKLRYNFYHLIKIFKTKELSEAATIRNFRIVRKEVNRQVSRKIYYKKVDEYKRDWESGDVLHYELPGELEIKRLIKNKFSRFMDKNIEPKLEVSWHVSR